MPGPFRTILNNAGILLGGKALNAVISLTAIALTARQLGVEGFGVLILIHAYSQTVGEIVKFQSWQALLNYGTAPVLEKRLSEFHRVLRFSLSLDFLSGISGIVVAVAGIVFFGGSLGWHSADTGIAVIYMLSIFFNVSATPTGALRLVDRFDLLAVESTIESWIKLAGAAIAWVIGGDLAYFLMIWFIAKVVSFVFLFGAAAWTLRRKELLNRFRWSQEGSWTMGMPGVWKFVWSTNFNSTLGLAFTQVGTLMVGSLLGATDAALYRIAKQLADAVAKPARLIVPALYPELARLALNPDRRGLRKLVWQLAVAGGGLATLLLLIVAVFGGQALTLLIGEAFAAAKPVMLWLLAGAVISIWAVPLEPLLISTGGASSAFWIRLAVTLGYVPFLYFMIVSRGLHGAGVAAVVGAMMLLSGQVWLVSRWFRQGRRIPHLPTL